MAYENGIRVVDLCFRDHTRNGHRPELRINELHLVPGIEQGPADRQQPERRQMLPRYTAANGGMGRIKQEDFHGRESFAVVQVPCAAFTLYYKVYDALNPRFVQIVITIFSFNPFCALCHPVYERRQAVAAFV